MFAESRRCAVSSGLPVIVAPSGTAARRYRRPTPTQFWVARGCRHWRYRVRRLCLTPPTRLAARGAGRARPPHRRRCRPGERRRPAAVLPRARGAPRRRRHGRLARRRVQAASPASGDR